MQMRISPRVAIEMEVDGGSGPSQISVSTSSVELGLFPFLGSKRFVGRCVKDDTGVGWLDEIRQLSGLKTRIRFPEGSSL